MTLLDVLLILRDRLQIAYEKNQRSDGELLMIIFDRLTEISYAQDNRALTGILVDLTDTARDVAMGVRGKAVMTKIEDIQAVFATTSREAS